MNNQVKTVPFKFEWVAANEYSPKCQCCECSYVGNDHVESWFNSNEILCPNCLSDHYYILTF